MSRKKRKVTVKYVREKYPEKYKHLTDKELERLLDLFYNVAYISIKKSQEEMISEDDDSNGKLSS